MRAVGAGHVLAHGGRLSVVAPPVRRHALVAMEDLDRVRGVADLLLMWRNIGDFVEETGSRHFPKFNSERDNPPLRAPLPVHPIFQGPQESRFPVNPETRLPDLVTNLKLSLQVRDRKDHLYPPWISRSNHV